MTFQQFMFWQALKRWHENDRLLNQMARQLRTDRAGIAKATIRLLNDLADAQAEVAQLQDIFTRSSIG